MSILTEIKQEQRHGRQKWGSGPEDLEHDDGHSREDWIEMIRTMLGKAEVATPYEWRRYMVKVAGLAISGIEAFDRNYK